MTPIFRHVEPHIFALDIRQPVTPTELHAFSQQRTEMLFSVNQFPYIQLVTIPGYRLVVSARGAICTLLQSEPKPLFTFALEADTRMRIMVMLAGTFSSAPFATMNSEADALRRARALLTRHPRQPGFFPLPRR
jgi:hypothetical protein